jgi:hypothetical protein
MADPVVTVLMTNKSSAVCPCSKAFGMMWNINLSTKNLFPGFSIYSQSNPMSMGILS